MEENSDREINPVDIERALNLKRSTVTGILQRLEEKGFIDLVASSSKDKRFKKIVFTEKSEKHKMAMEKSLNQLEQKLFQNICM